MEIQLKLTKKETKELAIEALGTMFLMLLLGFTNSAATVAIGLAGLVYMGVTISGSHFNPAISLALFLNKVISKDKLIKYIGAQFIGALIGALIILATRGTAVVPRVASDYSEGSALVLEILFTGLLCFVVLMVAVNKKAIPNQYYGLAIGAALMIGLEASGVYNPAIALATNIAGLFKSDAQFGDMLLFLGGQIIGAGLAGYGYQYLMSDDKEEVKASAK